MIDPRLIGQQARPIVREMRQAGLLPTIVWTDVGQVPAGTIIAIEPVGDLAPGTVITVTVAALESE